MYVLRIYSEPEAVLSPKDVKIHKLESPPEKGFTVWWKNNSDYYVWFAAYNMSSQASHFI